MILLSDNLGVSALVNMVSASVPEGATESTVLGPFYVPESPAREWGESVLLRDGDDVPLLIHGRVLGPQGEPVPGAPEEYATAIQAALVRLTSEERIGMGRLIKAVALSSPNLDSLPGFEI